MTRKLLYLVTFFVLMSLSFNFHAEDDEYQITWLWEGRIQVPIILMLTAIICLAVYFYKRELVLEDED